MEALILVAENGGPTMLARIGVMWALNRHRVREFIRTATRRIGGQAEAEAKTPPVILHRADQWG
jgi:hypothetical protein